MLRSNVPPLWVLAVTALGGAACSLLVPLDEYAAEGPVDLGAGLVGHWRLDDGAGTAARDSSGNGGHGSLRGYTQPVAEWTQGKRAGGLRFGGDASKQHVVVASSAGLNPDAAVSVAAWVNATSWCGSTTARRVLQKGEEVTQYRLLCEGAAIVFGVTGGNVSAPLPTAGQWHHLAGTYDGATLRLYVDGVETPQPASGKLAVTASDLFIGAKNASGHFWNGVIDDVMVYGRALGAAEVRALLNGREPPAR